MDDILPMTGLELWTGVQLSVFCPSYIESSQIQNWDYAFIDLIEKKEIRKPFDWAKQIHMHCESKRLIYRSDSILIILS